jgi:hypothetical protein
MPPFLPKPLAPLLLLGALLAAGLALPVAAADVRIDPYYDWRDEVGRGEYDYDESQDIPWIESEAEVLAPPRPEDLVPVRIDSLPPGMELLIDRSRVTVGAKDRVVRAWLWTRGRAGPGNGTFEGFRCETREFKVYAYANPRREPQVSLARRPAWQPIKGPKSRSYRMELLEDYFCGIRGTRTAREIVENLSGDFRRERFLSE